MTDKEALQTLDEHPLVLKCNTREAEAVKAFIEAHLVAVASQWSLQ